MVRLAGYIITHNSIHSIDYIDGKRWRGAGLRDFGGLKGITLGVTGKLKAVSDRT
jgi:hypothetical protein